MIQKILVIIFIFSIQNAFAEGPVLECKATREGPRSNGKPGFELIDSKVIHTVIDDRLKKTTLVGASVSTYINIKGQYVLVINDQDLETSSTTMGTVDNDNINLSLSGKGLSNYISCQIK